MEFCALGDLAAFVKKRDKLASHAITAEMMRHYPNPPGSGFNEVIVRHFAKQLASALEYLRSKNFVHRDVKPQNLLLNPPPSWIATERPENRPHEVAKNALIPKTGVESLPTLKLGDFGFARQLENKGMAETLCGSPLYMAPEILRYEKYDAKADLWSVGAVLFELMTGKPPFRAANHVELLRRIEKTMDKITFADDLIISEDMRSCIRSLLKKMPTERVSWDEFFRCAVIVDDIPGLLEVDKPKSKTVEGKAFVETTVPSRQPPSELPPTQERSQPIINRRLSTARPSSGTPPGPSPLSRQMNAETSQPLPRPGLTHNATAPNPYSMRRGSVNTSASVARRGSYTPSPGTSAPAGQGERERMAQRSGDRTSRDARDKTDQDIRFERDYVIIEKRQVQVNALADEINARSPQPGTIARRSTTQGTPTLSAGTQPSSSRNAPSATTSHSRKESYERRYGPIKASASSALANALNMVQYRLYGTALGHLGKSPSPPQGYGPFPTFPSQPSGPFVAGEGGKAGQLDEDQRMLTTVEEAATRSDVVFGFAEVKYKQLIPLTPSNDNALGIRTCTPGDEDENEETLTQDAIVNISEEALVLYVKTLAILNNTFNLAGIWWNERGRGEQDVRERASIPVRINHVVQWARNRFNECLEKTEYVGRRLTDAQKRLPRRHPSHPDNQRAEDRLEHKDMSNHDLYLTSGITAEKLMYDRAVDMSRGAGINELTGQDLYGCEIAYMTAKRLFEAVLETDDEIKPKQKVKQKEAKDGHDGSIEGIEEADRARIIERKYFPMCRSTSFGSPDLVVESLGGRLHTLRKKIAAGNAARRNSKVSGVSPPKTTVQPSSPKRSSPRPSSLSNMQASPK